MSGIKDLNADELRTLFAENGITSVVYSSGFPNSNNQYIRVTGTRPGNEMRKALAQRILQTREIEGISKDIHVGMMDSLLVFEVSDGMSVNELLSVAKGMQQLADLADDALVRIMDPAINEALRDREPGAPRPHVTCGDPGSSRFGR